VDLRYVGILPQITRPDSPEELDLKLFSVFKLVPASSILDYGLSSAKFRLQLHLYCSRVV
jgi:hypothetical protein